MGKNEEQRPSVAEALRLLAQGAGLQRGDDELLSLLDGRLQVLTAAWHLDLTKGAKNVRIAIQAQLVAHLRQITPKSRRPQGGSYQSLIGEQRISQFEQVVLVLFNVNSWFSGKFDGPDQKDRYGWIDTDQNHQRGDGRISYRIKPATARRDFDYAIQEIAKVLAGNGGASEECGVQHSNEVEPAAILASDSADMSVAPSIAQTIDDFDPSDLGVHRPINGDGSITESTLPPYAERRHDQRLHEVLSDIAKSVMVVLTGGSSTGKTRTAWEAVKACLSDWQFSVPHDLDELVQVVGQQTEQSQTIVWLDEAQELLQSATDKATRTLWALLTGPGCVVVLATMWTDPYWQRFTTEPARGEPDSWRLLRALLLDSRRVIRIRVSESFADEPAAFDVLRSLAQTDSRLAEAVEGASDGKVIQTLSGGTLLLERYREAANDHRHAWAVITAAIDACRLGHEHRLPVEVLQHGAHGYLSDDADRVGGEGWFDTALQYATHGVRGIAILRPARSRSASIGSADSEPHRATWRFRSHGRMEPCPHPRSTPTSCVSARFGWCSRSAMNAAAAMA